MTAIAKRFRNSIILAHTNSITNQPNRRLQIACAHLSAQSKKHSIYIFNEWNISGAQNKETLNMQSNAKKLRN